MCNGSYLSFNNAPPLVTDNRSKPSFHSQNVQGALTSASEQLNLERTSLTSEN